MTGLIEGAHAAAAAFVGPELQVSKAEARKIAEPAVDCAELWGVDMQRYAKGLAVGRLATAIAEVEGPRIRAILAKPAAGPQKGAATSHAGSNGSHAGVRPTFFVPVGPLSANG